MHPNLKKNIFSDHIHFNITDKHPPRSRLTISLFSRILLLLNLILHLRKPKRPGRRWVERNWWGGGEKKPNRNMYCINFKTERKCVKQYLVQSAKAIRTGIGWTDLNTICPGLCSILSPHEKYRGHNLYPIIIRKIVISCVMNNVIPSVSVSFWLDFLTFTTFGWSRPSWIWFSQDLVLEMRPLCDLKEWLTLVDWLKNVISFNFFNFYL